jgi:hypothetical protein
MEDAYNIKTANQKREVSAKPGRAHWVVQVKSLLAAWFRTI